ncbi:hypothetical protein AB3S75_011403 [Citrus x aurantiifolia]
MPAVSIHKKQSLTISLSLINTSCHFPVTIMKLFAVFVLVILFLQALAVVEASTMINNASNNLANRDGASDVLDIHKKHHPQKIYCSQACNRRCKESSRKNMCHRACRTCCKRCHCVPPGTYGNKQACPCYASLRTHGNRPKCP